MKRLGVVAVVACVLSAGVASGKTYKYDQFPADLAAAATAASGIALATQPGFAQGEAFGVFFRPDAGDYPIKITGIDMILAAPPNAPTLSTHAMIEVWLVSGDGPSPGKETPDFQISTADLLNPTTRQVGMPLVGNTGLSIAFDPDDPAGHPPVINSGNFLVMVRFTQPSRDMQTEWGTFQCNKSFGCGCQNVGTLHDQSSTPKANVLNYLEPMGNCNGTPTGWAWMNAVGINGDVILRVQAETGGGCMPDCTGKACGPDGCGGACGQCGPGQTCEAGQCKGDCVPTCDPPKPCGPDGCGGTCGECDPGESCQVGQCKSDSPPPLLALSGISPDWGWADEPTPVTVFGSGFEEGIVVRLGAAQLTSVVVESPLKLTAVVPNLFSPAKYTLSVMNPDGATAMLENAFEVRARPTAEAAPEVVAEPEEDAVGGDADTGRTVIPPRDSGCNGGATAAGPAVLLLLALAAVQRRRA